jgi:DUF4097 and DUF4098 domain-containing protein YvlB
MASEFDTPQPISAVIDIVMGDVRIAAGERSDTVVQVQPSDPSKRADVSAAEQTRVDYTGGNLSVKTARRWKSYSPFSGGGSVDVQIALPAASRVTAQAAIAAFRCTGALGECRIKTAVGDLDVEQAVAPKLTTAAGNITVERVSGDADLSTGTGEVRVGEIDGTATIKNSNGATRVAGMTGDLRVKAANGNIDVERSNGSLAAKTAHGDIHLGGVRRGAVVAETGFGEVEIAIADGAAAWLDLNTGYGHLHNNLERAEPPESNDNRVEVRARSGYGDITIRRSA